MNGYLVHSMAVNLLAFHARLQFLYNFEFLK
jgi:hypothetical protein